MFPRLRSTRKRKSGWTRLHWWGYQMKVYRNGTAIGIMQKLFPLRLESSASARILPMKIKLNRSKNPVEVKLKKYSAEQNLFMDNCIDRVIEFGFIVPNITAHWQAAPHLTPKSLPGMFTTIIDLRPVSKATQEEI